MTIRQISSVDVEPNIFRGYQQPLYKQFPIDTAQGGVERLTAVVVRGPRVPSSMCEEFKQEERCKQGGTHHPNV